MKETLRQRCIQETPLLKKSWNMVKMDMSGGSQRRHREWNRCSRRLLFEPMVNAISYFFDGIESSVVASTET